MNRYCFATLAINEPYESKTATFYKDLRENTKEGSFFITTTNENLLNQGDRIHTKIINATSLHCSGAGFTFNLNLKVLSLKHVLEFEKENPDNHHDYVIFTDGDWGMYSGFTEEKVLSMLDYMERENIDCLFERPAHIGGYKKNMDACFFTDKLRDYNVFDHTKWDDAHVVNEQFLVFRNNWKFRYFVQRWEQFLWYTVANDIRNYPDGFEIGISILESEMKYEYQNVLNFYVPQCFYFYDKSGGLFIRF